MAADLKVAPLICNRFEKDERKIKKECGLNFMKILAYKLSIVKNDFSLIYN